MDIPEIRQKYADFAQKQLALRAARQRKESMDMMQVGVLLPVSSGLLHGDRSAP